MDQSTFRGKNVFCNLHQSVDCCRPNESLLQLSQKDLEFLHELRTFWNYYKDSRPAVLTLEQFLESNGRPPHVVAIALVNGCHESGSPKPRSLPFFIIETLNNWLKRNQSVSFDEEFKMNVLKFSVLQSTLAFTKLLIDVFNIRGCNLKSCHNFIECLLSSHRYRDACILADLLEENGTYDVQDFLVPLILQGKVSYVDDYLKRQIQYRQPIVIFFDEVLGHHSPKDILLDLGRSKGVPDIKMDNICSKAIRKLLNRWIKTFHITTEMTPNFNHKRNAGVLQFLFHKRYANNESSLESWREMVQEAVGDDSDLKKEVIVQLCALGDFTEAKWWAHLYNIEKEHWPSTMVLADVLSPPNTQASTSQWADNEWDEVVSKSSHPAPTSPSNSNQGKAGGGGGFYPFNLPEQALVLINNRHAFTNLLDRELKSVTTVGLDCEWKPNFVASQQNQLAVMQIATWHKVFILDILALNVDCGDLWMQLGEDLFYNENILKLVFGFLSDRGMIKHSIPTLNLNHRVSNLLDLTNLWAQMDKYSQIEFPHKVNVTGRSLNTLVECCFGRPLDKSEQFSNWEKRPLRRQQLLYAALDAYCLLEIYEAMKMYSKIDKTRFDALVLKVMSTPNTTENNGGKGRSHDTYHNRRKLQNTDEIVRSPWVKPRSVIELHVVCDNMLQGLGKNLRRCGVDCIIMSNDNEHMDCIRVAQDQKRFVVTKGIAYKKLCGYLPQGHVFSVKSDNVDVQLKEVLEYFNVHVTEQDIFSVCQACNGRLMIQVPNDVLTQLYYAWHRINKTYRSDSHAFDETDGFEDEYDDENNEFDDVSCMYVKPKETAIDKAPLPANPYPEQPNTSKNWELIDHTDTIDVHNCLTKSGASIHVNDVPSDLLGKVKIFYICDTCGKVYWDGSHFKNVVQGRLREVVR